MVVLLVLKLAVCQYFGSTPKSHSATAAMWREAAKRLEDRPQCSAVHVHTKQRDSFTAVPAVEEGNKEGRKEDLLVHDSQQGRSDGIASGVNNVTPIL